MPSPFDLPFVQRGAIEVLLLAAGAGVIGTWIVLRGLAFYAHAVGTAAFPGLVLADGIGFSATLGAASTGLLVAGGVGWLGRRDGGESNDSVTALVLVAALAAGVILASDVFRSGSNVETLLFGSLLLVDWQDVVFAGVASAVALIVAWTLHSRWLLTGFDPRTAPALGARSPLPDAALLGVVTLLAVAALSTLGALLATAVLVVPAATTRLWFDRMGAWQIATVLLVALEGVGGLWLSVETNAPPGAAIAVLSGSVFALAAIARAIGPRRRRVAVAMAGAAIVMGASGCGTGPAPSGRIEVVATTTQLADIAREVGGDAVHVEQLLRPNTDPHDYEPRPNDVLRVAASSVAFTSGDGIDDWIGEVIRQSGAHPLERDLSTAVTSPLDGERHGEEASRYDPHWWHDPRNVEAAANVIAETLNEVAAPSKVAGIKARARAYVAKVQAMDRQIAGCFDALPRAQRKLVTDHDAFGYFARRYDIEVVGAVIPSQTTQGQPSARAVSDLAKVIRREHVRAVFPETSLNTRLVKAIAKQTGASAEHELYGDTLGPASSKGGTYIGMELANADAMVRGFTGGRRGCP